MQINTSRATTYPNTGRYFFFEAVNGKHHVSIILSAHEVRVIVHNASNKAFRGMGKGFPTVAAALANYKTASVRQVITVAHYEDRVSKLEEEGLTRSDAQGCVEAEDLIASRSVA